LPHIFSSHHEPGVANRPSWYQSPSGTTFRSSSFFLSEKDFIMMPEQLEHTLPGRPCLAQYPAYDNSAATTSPDPIVPIVPTVPTALAAPGPTNDQDTNSQATLVPIVPLVPIGEWRSTRFRVCWREPGSPAGGTPLSTAPGVARQGFEECDEDTRAQKGDQERTPEMKCACDAQEAG